MSASSGSVKKMPLDKFQDRQIARLIDEDNLSDWEYRFLNSIAEEKSLTDRQASKLNEIMQRVDFG